MLISSLFGEFTLTLLNKLFRLRWNAKFDEKVSHSFFEVSFTLVLFNFPCGIQKCLNYHTNTAFLKNINCQIKPFVSHSDFICTAVLASESVANSNYLCVSLCVCLFLTVCVCFYFCVCVCLSMCVSGCVCLFLHVCVSVCVFVPVCPCLCLSLSNCVCVYVSLYLCMSLSLSL